MHSTWILAPISSFDSVGSMQELFYGIKNMQWRQNSLLINSAGKCKYEDAEKSN